MLDPKQINFKSSNLIQIKVWIIDSFTNFCLLILTSRNVQTNKPDKLVGAEGPQLDDNNWKEN